MRFFCFTIITLFLSASGFNETSVYGRKAGLELSRLDMLGLKRPEQAWLRKQTDMFLTIIEVTTGISDEQRLKVVTAVREFVQDIMGRSSREIFRTAYIVQHIIQSRNMGLFGNEHVDHGLLMFSLAHDLYEDIGINLFENHGALLGIENPDRLRALARAFTLFMDYFPLRVLSVVARREWLRFDMDELLALVGALESFIGQYSGLMEQSGVGGLFDALYAHIPFPCDSTHDPMSKERRMAAFHTAITSRLSCSEANKAIFQAAIGPVRPDLLFGSRTKEHVLEMVRHACMFSFNVEGDRALFCDDFMREFETLIYDCEQVESDRIIALVNRVPLITAPVVPRRGLSVPELMLDAGMRMIERRAPRVWSTIEANRDVLRSDSDKVGVIRRLFSQRRIISEHNTPSTLLETSYRLVVRFGMRATELEPIDRQLVSSLMYWPGMMSRDPIWRTWLRATPALKLEYMEARKALLNAKKFEESASTVPVTASGSPLDKAWLLAIGYGVHRSDSVLKHLFVPGLVKLIPLSVRKDLLVANIGTHLHGYPVWINKLLVAFDKLFRHKIVYEPRFGMTLAHLIRYSFEFLVMTDAVVEGTTPRFAATVTALYNTVDYWIRSFPANPSGELWELYRQVDDRLRSFAPIIRVGDADVVLEGPVSDAAENVLAEIMSLIPNETTTTSEPESDQTTATTRFV
jgi:hypothetical protein